jgi:hypothetical protein
MNIQTRAPIEAIHMAPGTLSKRSLAEQHDITASQYPSPFLLIRHAYDSHDTRSFSFSSGQACFAGFHYHDARTERSPLSLQLLRRLKDRKHTFAAMLRLQSHAVLQRRPSNRRLEYPQTNVHKSQTSSWGAGKLRRKAETEPRQGSEDNRQRFHHPRCSLWTFRVSIGSYFSAQPVSIPFDYREPTEYLTIRGNLVNTLRDIQTRDAVEARLEHAIDLLRICGQDKFRYREIAPCLYLRLRRDQECYDFLKWCATEVKDKDYVWKNSGVIFLSLKGHDPTESPEPMWTSQRSDIAQAICVILIKLRILLDFRDLEASAELYKLVGANNQKLNVDIVQEIREKVASRSGIWSHRPEWLGPEGMGVRRAALLAKHVDKLFGIINESNKFFWTGLLEHKKWAGRSPLAYTRGSKDEMLSLLLNQSAAWIETEGSLEWVRRKLGA